jgi:Protein of unknown function (DUF2927)
VPFRFVVPQGATGTDYDIEIEHPQSLIASADAKCKIEGTEFSENTMILPVDAGEFTFYDCAYEELLQALGAINDDRSISWRMFNDGVQMGFFDVYDQYLLNILHDPRIRPYMTKGEVNGLLPAVLPSVRAWVTNVNPPSHRDGRNGQKANPTHGVKAALPRSMNAQTGRGTGAT